MIRAHATGLGADSACTVALPRGALDRGLIVPHLAAHTKMGAIKELVDRLHERGVIHDSLRFLQSVLERENLQSTILDDTVALPHARCHSVNRLAVAVGVARPPLEYASGDEVRNITVVCLIAVPTQSAGPYLDLMSALARRLSDPLIRARLQAAADLNEFEKLLLCAEPLLRTAGRLQHHIP